MPRKSDSPARGSSPARRSRRRAASSSSVSGSDGNVSPVMKPAKLAVNTSGNMLASVSSSTSPLFSTSTAHTQTRTPQPMLATESRFDPTLSSFLSKPHTITALVAMLAGFFYVAMYVTDVADSARNTKIGLMAMAGVLILLGLLMFNDGPFVRPHPAFWRMVLASSAVYQLLLVFLLFQNVDDARKLMTHIYPNLGVELPERSYANDCTLSVSNVIAQMDEFVLAHVFGWVVKALMMRDYWIGWILSVMFELLEYSLEHQLPNFAECWWDHWILDVLVCNWLGLFIGMKLCSLFEMQTYAWTGFRQIPTYSGKMKRAVQQFTPETWTKFEWQATKKFSHFITVVFVAVVFLQAEVNAFYLKFLLWVPPRNPLNAYRLVYFSISAAPSVREAYQYLTDPYGGMAIASVLAPTPGSPSPTS